MKRPIKPGDESGVRQIAANDRRHTVIRANKDHLSPSPSPPSGWRAPARVVIGFGSMSDRIFYPLAALIALAMIGLALVWPQGTGLRSPGPFGHPAATPAAAGRPDSLNLKPPSDAIQRPR
jgi:hypothetical protein